MCNDDEIDLFDNFDELPIEVQTILLNDPDASIGDGGYDVCERLLLQLEPLGYIFDYGLDCQPFRLRLI